MQLIKSTLDIIVGIGTKALSFFRYFGIGCHAILTSKVSIVVLVICLLLVTLQGSTGFREEIIKKEQEMMFESESSIDYYYDEVDVVDYGDNMAITDMIDCYQSSVNLDEISSNILETIEELEDFYRGGSWVLLCMI